MTARIYTRVLVTGSRGWEDRHEMIETRLWELLHEEGRFTLVHGACPNSPDTIAAGWAKKALIPVDPHPADWNAHGRRAGFVRNAGMISTLSALRHDRVLAFWDGASTGTKNTIDLALKAKITTEVFFS